MSGSVLLLAIDTCLRLPLALMSDEGYQATAVCQGRNRPNFVWRCTARGKPFDADCAWLPARCAAKVDPIAALSSELASGTAMSQRFYRNRRRWHRPKISRR